MRPMKRYFMSGYNFLPRDNKHTSQMLMPPIVLTLSISEQEALKTNERSLKAGL